MVADDQTPYPKVPSRADYPAIERRDPRALEGATGPSSASVEPAARRRQRVRLLRRPAVRQRPAPLRPPAHRLREGRRPPLPDDAGPPGRAPLRLGLPRPAGRDGGREGARASPAARPSPSTASTASTTTAARRCCATPTEWEALRHPPGPLGRLRERLQDDGPLLHGERHVGVQAALGQGPRLRGLPGACPTRGAPRRRCRTSRSASTTPPGPARTRRSPSRSTLDARRRRPRRRCGSWRGRPRRGRCRPTSPSPSGPTSTTRSSRTTASATSSARRRVERVRRTSSATATRGRDDQGRRPRRAHATTPLFPYFADHRQRVPRARRRLRRHRRGHRRRAHRARLRRGRPAGRARPTASRSWCRSTTRAASPTRCPTGPGVNVFEANPADHPRTSRSRAASCATTRYDAQLPALLAHRHADHLPRDVVVVRRGHRVPRPHASSSTSRSTGSPTTSATARSASGSRAPATGRSAATASGARRSRSGAATTPPTRASTSTARIDELERDFGVAADRPAPAVHRRAGAAQPRRPDRQVDDAARARGARLLVRVGLDALRPGALPVREQGVVRATTSRRLHRRVHRPDARLVLHAARAVGGAVRPARVPELHLPRRRARRGRPQAVQAAAQLPRPRGGVRDASAPTRCAGSSWRRRSCAAATCASTARARASPRSCASCSTRSGTPTTSSRSTPTPTATARRCAPTRPQLLDRYILAKTRELVEAVTDAPRRLRPRRRVRRGHGVPRRAQQLVHPPQPATASGRRPAPSTPTQTSATRSTRSTRCCTRWPGSRAPLLPLLAEEIYTALTGERVRAPRRLARRRPRCPPTPSWCAPWTGCATCARPALVAARGARAARRACRWRRLTVAGRDADALAPVRRADRRRGQREGGRAHRRPVAPFGTSCCGPTARCSAPGSAATCRR